MLMMIDDNRINLQPGEVIKKRMVRFRTTGLLAADRRGGVKCANTAGDHRRDAGFHHQ